MSLSIKFFCFLAICLYSFNNQLNVKGYYHLTLIPSAYAEDLLVNHQDMIKKSHDFRNKLKSQVIKPSVVYDNEQTAFAVTGKLDTQNFTTKFQILDLVIIANTSKKGLTLTVNNHQIKTYKLKTLNQVWAEDKPETLEYADSLRQVKYYKDKGYIIFDIYRENCNGTGCGTSYQVIYDIKTQKTYAFGKFRLGNEPNLYFDEQSQLVYYVSSHFEGLNGDDDSTTYQLFDLNRKNPIFLSKYYAKFTYSPETFTESDENLVSFNKVWLKSFN